ncbi:MAG: [protein-PII] uridylyltransferase [Sutterellaceae bacterium]|nr:[protein-PII] uridylyltransferase [Sutterellaceae bacterium]
MTEQRLLESFQTIRQKIADDFLAHGRVSSYLKRNTATIDRFVVEMAARAGMPADHALVAVGGYGRGEMFPYSDIDLLVLLPDNHCEESDAKVGAFVTNLWSLGLTVGSVVRTKDEMLREAKADITVATAFLEARFLSGDEDLFHDTYKAFFEILDPKTFFRSKMLEMRQRHQKFDDTPYALEPNIKESPGGLRDLQVFLWCAHCAGFGRNWKELATSGLITETEAYHLSECQHFLRDLRIRLHLLRKRHEDRLIFDVQTALAENAGYKAIGALLPSESLMKRYYLNAKNTAQLQQILLSTISDRLFQDQFKPAVTPIDDVFIATGDALDIVSEEAFRADHHNILKAFYLFATHRELKRLSTLLLRSLWHLRDKIDADFRNDAQNKALFIKALQLRYGPYHFLKNLNVWGILGRFLPVWRRIVGQMQHDLFHAYTVDQHTLRVVKFIRRFAHSSYAHEYPLCSQIINDIDKPWRLTVAGLFHDIAKGRGGNHSELGAKEVHTFGKSFGLDKEDTAYLEFLVREHLLMSNVAQKQDITSPEVVERFAKTVGTKERLDGLFLLTVADIRATSPKVWNGWKARLLTELYQSTLRTLQGEGAAQTRASILEEHRSQACRLIAEMGVDDAKRDAFFKELNIVYFLRHSPEDIAWHTKELADVLRTEKPVVRSRILTKGAGVEVLVYTHDQKDLFARVVAFFERVGLSVLDARIHTTAHGWALDTFLVQDKRARTDDPDFKQKLTDKLTKVIEEAKPLPEPKQGKLSRRSRSFPTPTLIEIERDESQKSWVLQVTCSDRLGLLFAIAVVLAKHDINLATAKISTLDERAEDVFLIDGAVLQDQTQLVAIEGELIDAINFAK